MIFAPLRLFLIWTPGNGRLGLMFIVRSRFGVTLRAIKSNGSRVEAMGLYPLRFKMVGYLLSAVICGIAGHYSPTGRNMSRPTSCIGRGQAN